MNTEFSPEIEIGLKIRELRMRKGYSQENMADLLNMSVSNYSYIEQGKVDLKVKKLYEIAKVLETNVHEIHCVGEKNVFYIQDNRDNSQNGYIINQSLPSSYLQLEKENKKLSEDIAFYKNKIDSLEKS